MADFNQAVKKTLIHEGGYSNNPADPGGETYRGISRVNHSDWEGWKIIDGYRSRSDFPKCLDADTRLQTAVVKVYVDGYWKDLYSQIDDQLLAEKLFDMGVLIGVRTSVKLLQISMKPQINLVSDGVFGQNTLDEVNQSQISLVPGYKHLLLQHFLNVVSNSPETAVFLNGWITRVNS